jgi:hypothetical protein
LLAEINCSHHAFSVSISTEIDERDTSLGGLKRTDVLEGKGLKDELKGPGLKNDHYGTGQKEGQERMRTEG